jgi:hypothetical protein
MPNLGRPTPPPNPVAKVPRRVELTPIGGGQPSGDPGLGRLPQPRPTTKDVTVLPTSEQYTMGDLLYAVWNELSQIHALFRTQYEAIPLLRPFGDNVLAVGARVTLMCEFEPKSWIVWSNTPVAATDQIRVSTGTDVASAGSVAVYGGRKVRIPGRGQQLTIFNAGANAQTVHAIATTGDFDIGTV